MFIAELTRKLAAKRREEVESPVNIIRKEMANNFI